MNKNDRKKIQLVIDQLEESKGELESIVEELDERASNLENSNFVDRAEKLQDESYNVQNIVDSIDAAINDAQAVIEQE